MPKFNAYASVSGGKYLGTFEAEDADAAADMAWASEKAYVSLCHHCAPQCEDAQVTDISVEPCDE